MADRPIIRLQLPGDTVEEFQRAAALQLGREFFVELDTPAVELVRIEAPFKSGAIAVRAEATAKAASREGRSGALIRLTRLEPNSYGVPIPPGSAWPEAAEVIEVRRKPDGPVIARTTTPVAKPAIARTATPHLLRRVVEIEVDDPVAEFQPASITKNSPVSADLAKQLNERPTPPPSPKTPSIIRRQTPVAGVPSIPKPVEKKIQTPPSVPPIDDEWTFDAPTLGPATKATVAKPAPVVPAKKPPPTPAKGVPAVKKPLDDDAAFDDAFGMLEDDLSIPVEPSKATPVARTVDEITKPVPAPDLLKEAARPTPPTPIARTDEITKPVSNPAAQVKPRLPTDPAITTPKIPTPPSGVPKTQRIPTEPPARVLTPPSGVPKTQRIPTEPPARVLTPPSGVPKTQRIPTPAIGVATEKPKTQRIPTPASGVPKTQRIPTEPPAKRRPSEPAIGEPTVLSSEPDQDEIPTFDPAKPKPRVSTDPPIAKRLSTNPGPLDQDEIPTFDPAKPTKPIVKPDFAEPPKPDEITRPMTPSAIAELATPAPTSRPSSEGVLATPRASALAMPTGTNEIDAIEQGTSTGAIGSTRATSETLRPKSKLPLILVAIAALAGIVVVVVLATRGGGTTPDPKPTPKPSVTKTEVDKHLREAASLIADGKLVSPGGDAALDHLLAAKAIAPDDVQVLAQLKALADKFEALGDGAVASKDLGEAAAHYQAALIAAPDRASAKTKLADVENRVRGKP